METQSYNGVSKSENTCPGGNKSGASVSIILSTSSFAVSCKVYKTREKSSWEKKLFEHHGGQGACPCEKDAQSFL